MAKRLDKFTDAFRQSRIPFLLAEVLTDGRGEMVDLVFRFANAPAAALLNLPETEVRSQRFTRAFPGAPLAALAPLQTVAFSGSAASFSYTTLLGQTVEITCYQPMYGMAACILDARDPRDASRLLAEQQLPGTAAVWELSRTGVRCLSFSQRLCELTGWDRRTLLDRCGADVSALAAPEDWPDLLQALLDAARDRRALDHDFRLLRQDGTAIWVNLRAEPVDLSPASASFYAMLTDIDARRRRDDLLSDRLCRAESGRALAEGLLDHLPLGTCLVRRTAGGQTEPLFLSRALAELLGYEREEFFRHMAEEPLWRVLAADRPGLLDSAARAWAAGQPLCRTCRLRPRSGPAVTVALEVRRETQTDGSFLFHVLCAPGGEGDAAPPATGGQLQDLLLDRSRLLILDYEPATDLARIQRYEADGLRTNRTLFGYRAGLPNAAHIHPDDRKVLAAALRRVLTRPAAKPLEFRADYDGRGWRWYRVTWTRLFDGAGNVYRLLGKAEDVSLARAARERVDLLAAAQDRLDPGTMASIRLDLTADRILDVKSAGDHLLRVLFGNTADACLRHMRDNIPDPALRDRFDAIFRRQTLLDAFHRGERRLELDHPLLLGDRCAWGRSTAELAEDPDSAHILAFCSTRSIVSLRRDAALDALADRAFQLAVSVDGGGLCLIHGQAGNGAPEGIPYQALVNRWLRQALPPSPRRTALRRAMARETVLAHLRGAEEYALPFPDEDGPLLRWTWLDRAEETLLVTWDKAL